MEEVLTTNAPTTEDLQKGVTDNAKSIADKLSITMGRRVYPIVLADVSEKDAFVIGYAYEPDLTTQCRLIDRSDNVTNGISLEAAVTAIGELIIVTESDKRLTDESGKHFDLYRKGAAYTLVKFMGLAKPIFF